MSHAVMLEVLDEVECRRLLAATDVGRVAFVGPDGFPVVLPVNFVVDGDLGRAAALRPVGHEHAMTFHACSSHRGSLVDGDLRAGTAEVTRTSCGGRRWTAPLGPHGPPRGSAGP